MTTKEKAGAHGAVVAALATVLDALAPLGAEDQAWILESVRTRLGGPPAPRAGGGVPTANNPGGGSGSGSITPKEFLRQKAPQTDVQRVACLAYYLSHYRGTPRFKTKDLTDLNIEAQGSTIGNPSQAVANATKQNDFFTPVGGGGKQITTSCEDVVSALPDQEKVSALETKKPKRRRRSTKGEA